MSEAAIERGRLLLEQGRMAMAESEFRRGLADEPSNAAAHSLLAVALQEQKKSDEALREAREGVRLDPTQFYPQYALGHILFQQEKHKEAREAVDEALRIDPHNADAFALLGSILLDMEQPRAALEAADRGLAIDAEHVECANLRAMTLMRLRRKGEASETIHGVLQREPENALAHANKGWACLHANTPRLALEHFREALRLEPGMEWARDGMLHAMRANYFVYRLMLAYFLWMSTLSSRTRTLLILGAYVVVQIGRVFARFHPELAPFIWPLVGLYFAFVLLTWISEPFFNLLLRLNRYGRYILEPKELVISNCLGLVLLIAIACGVAYPFVEDRGALVSMAVGAAMLAMVVGSLSSATTRESMIARGSIAGCLALLFLTAIALYWFVDASAARIVSLVYVIAAIICIWTFALRGANR